VNSQAEVQMSSKIPIWDLSPSDLSMQELGTPDQIVQKLLKKKEQVACVFDYLLGQSGHNTQEAAYASRWSPNKKQMLILALGQAADFEAFSDDKIIKVGISQALNGITPVGSYVYISQNDSVTKLKEDIRESLMFSGGEMVLREGYRGGDIINAVSVQGEKGISRVVTGDSDATMLSLGFKERFLEVKLEVIDTCE